MAVAWTKHRFSGGVLALDTANTVVLRGDPRGFDRFADPAEIARFAAAARTFRADELGDRPTAAAPGIAATVIGIREATDRLFRGSVERGALMADDLSRLLSACAEALGGYSGPVTLKGEAGQGPLPFEAALALSALSLLPEERWKKMRICPNCGWLFLDRSRNSSRLWCDMAVCGNRHKAKRHYHRIRNSEEHVHVGN